MAKHCWEMSTNFLFSKACWQCPSNVLSLHFEQTFPHIIWIFTEGEGDRIEPRLLLKIFFTLKWYSYLRKKPQCQRISETKARKTRPANTARSNIQSGIARPSRKSPPIEMTLEVTENTMECLKPIFEIKVRIARNFSESTFIEIFFFFENEVL